MKESVTSKCNPSKAVLSSAHSPVRICVFYQDEVTRARAFHLERYLCTELKGVSELSFSWWRIGFLYHPRLLSLAAKSIHRDAIIVFSLRARTELPLSMECWFEDNLVNGARPKERLLALLEIAGDESNFVPFRNARSRLSDMARRAGESFLEFQEGICGAKSHDALKERG